jgi:hypothetical protein
MKRAVLIAAAVTPIIAAAAGVAIARFANARADERASQCGEPTVFLDLADGAAMVTAGPHSVAACEGNSCRVEGPEQVEVQADGRVRCVEVESGMTLALTRRADGLSLVMQESGR